MRKFLLIILLFQFSGIGAQVWFRISAVPANTPSGDDLFLAGSFNNWNEASQAFRFEQSSPGLYYLQTQIGNGTYECKITRGSWTSVEGSSSGNFIPNRTISVQQGDTIDFTVAGWEDLAGNAGTALPTVSLLSNDFFMPQLNRSRRIWVCLPTDYQDSTEKRYPVIYMQDGQNLFDQSLSFAGEWQIDEHMRDLMEQGDRGAIIVGIENGGSTRINEYCPWNNPAYGGGEGKAYAEFMNFTLKPYIDNHFRTLSDANSTAVAGSSLGALISLYTQLEYPETFGKAGLFSPAFWINRDSLMHYITQSTIPESAKMYFVAGENESSSMVPDMELVANQINEQGVPVSQTELFSRTDGAHSEWFWSREFTPCYLWLFGAPVPPGFEKLDESNFNLVFFPNPGDSAISARIPEHETIEVRIFNSSGNLTDSLSTVENMLEISISKYPKGNYFVKATGNSGQTYLGQFQKR
ncbi:MAG: alpha/beta hydrolase-fold protein [Bacteroidia bacterium]